MQQKEHKARNPASLLDHEVSVMKYSISNRKNLTILKLEDQVFDIRAAKPFRALIEELLEGDRSNHIIIDFSQVKAVDSCGISSMLLAHKIANQSEGLAIFVALCQQIKELLRIASLDKQLYIFTSVNEVMTLIEPACKDRKAKKKSSKSSQDDEELSTAGVDEIAASDFADEVGMSGDEEEEDEEKDGNEHRDEDKPKTKKKATPAKKRGRPKKNS